MDSLAIVSEPPIHLPVGDVLATRRIGRILVAEDDVHMRRLVARALRTTGYRVVEASDGVEVLSALRVRDSAIPIVLVTGVTDAEVHREAYALGASAILTKPFDLDELGTVLTGLTAPAASA